MRKHIILQGNLFFKNFFFNQDFFKGYFCIFKKNEIEEKEANLQKTNKQGKLNFTEKNLTLK